MRIIIIKKFFLSQSSNIKYQNLKPQWKNITNTNYYHQSTMSNPTLINGFEDIITFIKQQEHRNKTLQEENKKLKEKVEEGVSVCEGAKESMEEMFEEIKKLKEANEKLKEENGDLKSRLEDVNHTAEEWEDSYNEVKEELIPVNRKIFIQDYIIKNMLYKLLCDGEEAEIEIPKKWRVDGVDSFTLEYSDIMKEVCKEMDEDDWNDDGSNLTLDWHNDTLEVVLSEEEE